MGFESIWGKVRDAVSSALVVVLILSALCSWVIGADSNTPSLKRLAIISSKEVQDGGLSDLLTAKMGELKGIELVERDMLAKVTDEIAVSNMFGADQTENRRKAGAILRADVLILLSIEKIETQKEDQNNASMFGENSGHQQPKKEPQIRKSVKIVISDCASGARLRIAGVDFNDKNMPNTCEESLKIISGTLTQFEKGINQIIGVSHFISKSLIHDYDRYQGGFAYLLENAISSYPGIAVIEVEEARNIRVENQLKDDSKIKRLVPLFVEGEYEFKNNGSEGKTKLVDISVSISDSNGVIKKISKKDVTFNNVGDFLTAEAANEILGLAKIPSVKTFDVNEQFNVLAKRADEFTRLGAWEHSTGIREAAILLNPNSTEQRILLIKEYDRIKTSWKIKNEHFEYLIINKQINFDKALDLWKVVFSNLPVSEREHRNNIWLKECSELIEIDKASNYFSKENRWARLYNLIIESIIKSEIVTKDDLNFIFDFHNNLLPEYYTSVYQPVVRRFFEFCEKHLEPKWRSTNPSESHKAFFYLEHTEYFSEQDFVDFIAIMSNSSKALASFYGRYGLLYYEYKKKNKSVDGLREDLKLFMNDIKNNEAKLYQIIRDEFCKGYEHTYRGKKTCDEFLAEKPDRYKFGDEAAAITQVFTERIEKKFEKELIDDNFESNKTKKNRIAKRNTVPIQANTIEKSPQATEINSTPNENINSSVNPKHIIEGKLVFKKIPMKLKRVNGLIYSIEKRRWGSYPLKSAIKCDDSLDVLWGNSVILFMKQKDLLEEVQINRGKYHFTEVIWCGKYVWVGTDNDGLWLLDKEGKIVKKIDANDGLPPADISLKLCPVEQGKILAAGSFKPLNRGWCAIIEYHDDKVNINVFHKATRLPLKSDNREELYKDPNFIFTPQWVKEYYGLEKDNRIFVIGLMKTPTGQYNDKFALRVGLNNLKVETILIGNGEPSQLSEEDTKPYFSKNGIFFEPCPEGVECYAIPGKNLPGKNSDYTKICQNYVFNPYTKEGFAGSLIEYDGWLYVPGTIWFRFDPNTLKEEKLLKTPLPLLYSYQYQTHNYVSTTEKPNIMGLNYFWLSAYYGLVAWNEKNDFYQVLITDKEHDVMEESLKNFSPNERWYYRTFTFEDNNGLITDPGKLKGINLKIERRVKVNFGSDDAESYYQIEHIIYKYSDFKDGGYYPLGTYRALYQKNVEEINVTEDSPEKLVFKFNAEKTKAATDIVYFSKVIDALTNKPMPDFEFKVKTTGTDSNPKIVKTDSQGNFEIRVKSGQNLYHFETLCEGYCDIRIIQLDSKFKPDENGIIKLPPLKLFPAAKIKIYPCIEAYNSGKPSKDLRFYCELAFTNIQPDSKESLIFIEVSENTFKPDVIMNLPYTYKVPACIKFNIILLAGEGKFYPPKISQTFKLKQWEEIDLGRIDFIPAIKINIKAVDSQQNPVSNMVLMKRIEYVGHSQRKLTNDNGITTFYVEPNYPAIFKYGIKENVLDMEKSITFQIGGRDCNDKEYILKVPDDIANQLKK